MKNYDVLVLFYILKDMNSYSSSDFSINQVWKKEITDIVKCFPEYESKVWYVNNT